MTGQKKTTARQQKTKMISTQAWTPHWYVLDAEGKTLGRFAAEVAKILRGKHKTTFTPHSDNGDGVIIVNVDKIKVTGAKAVQKIYRYYTGHIGGLRETTYETMKEKKPEYILEHAVRGMMPKTKLGRRQRKRLRLFKGDKHTLAAQQPTTVDV